MGRRIGQVRGGVYSESNATDKINKKSCLHIKMYLLGFFRMDIANTKTLFKGLLPPPKVGGELVLDDEMLDPLQGRLHCLLDQPDDIQQIFFSR